MVFLDEGLLGNKLFKEVLSCRNMSLEGLVDRCELCAIGYGIMTNMYIGSVPSYSSLALASAPALHTFAPDSSHRASTSPSNSWHH